MPAITGTGNGSLIGVDDFTFAGRGFGGAGAGFATTAAGAEVEIAAKSGKAASGGAATGPLIFKLDAGLRCGGADADRTLDCNGIGLGGGAG